MLCDQALVKVWMLILMCQMENKIFAHGELSYDAWRSGVEREGEGLENSIRGQMELMDSYARISSVIEIEVEMDTDVPAAEAACSAISITCSICLVHMNACNKSSWILRQPFFDLIAGKYWQTNRDHGVGKS
ncbi:hypothetical protein Ancab_015472 [Ancistrocladus abbreviatus]